MSEVVPFRIEIPDAAPTWSADTAEVEADDAGPFASPRPTAIRISGITKAGYSHEASTKIRRVDPAVPRMNPSATACREPIFTASGVIAGVIRISAAAAGRVARPASSGLMPKVDGSWK